MKELILVLTALCLISSSAQAQKGKKNKKPLAVPGMVDTPGGVVQPVGSFNEPSQEDFPALLPTDTGALVAYIDHDGKQDVLMVREWKGENRFGEAKALSEPGLIYQPGIARAGDGSVWVCWSQLAEEGWRLHLKQYQGSLERIFVFGRSNNILPDLKTDRRGRVWVAWQQFEDRHSDILTAFYDPKTKAWAEPIRVTEHPAGDWEPRLAFGADDEALIVFDTYRSGNYDVWLARVSPGGAVTRHPISATSRHEARAEAAASPDGKTLYVAYESGTEGWGKDLGAEWRKQGGGLNYDRHVLVSEVALDGLAVKPLGNVTSLIPDMIPKPGSVGSPAVNLPEVIVDGEGALWLFFRYAPEKGRSHWRIAYTRFDPSSGAWSQAARLGRSPYCQDRRVSVGLGKDGKVLAAWPSDLRQGKQQGDCGIFLARVDQVPVPAGALQNLLADRTPWQPHNRTPERDHAERHTWEIDGETYTLVWGDVHRHTDFSNCRTTDDSCITDHYRYAIDAGGLDFLGTSDHTDAGKTYHAYEWWQTQKYADLFHNPEIFLGVYAYEREQRWPYGHRNVLFVERGGPIVYISRKTYEKSPATIPLGEPSGVKKGEIAPWELWRILREYGKRATTIEHTSAGGMGTDWSVYEGIDYKIETLVEIYQGSRESYEGVNAPQPAVATSGLPRDFGDKKAGVYQNALKLGHKLGAFASSDHRSTNVSYGGLYVKTFDRNGLFDAMEARLGVAATDKIYLSFSCLGKPMGSMFETNDKPLLKIFVDGTAPLSKVTILRNEQELKSFEPGQKRFETQWEDAEPLAGENRYYVRVEQQDGNMGWTSPVWVTVGR